MAKLEVGINDLASVNPELAREWHPTKNGDLTPYNITCGSEKKVWWLGSCGHEWLATVYNRSQGSRCPFCAGKRVLSGFNDLATTSPSLAAEWHPTKNGDLTPNSITQGSNKKVWWLGSCGHEWLAFVLTRSKGAGCPFCTDRLVLSGFNDLATTNPSLATEWHPTKNGDLTPNSITQGSEKKVWWLGSCGHEWLAAVYNRSQGAGCPFCAGRRVLSGFNDLATTSPSLAAEWHPTKNGDLTPNSISRGSEKKVWWLGSCGHEWLGSVLRRSYGAGCPHCEKNGRPIKKIIEYKKPI